MIVVFIITYDYVIIDDPSRPTMTLLLSSVRDGVTMSLEERNLENRLRIYFYKDQSCSTSIWFVKALSMLLINLNP